MLTWLSLPNGMSRARSPARLLGSLCLLQATTGFNWSVYFAYGGIFLQVKLGLSVEAIALLVSSSFLVYCIIQFGVSLVVDVGVRVVGLRVMLLRSPIFYGLGLTILVLGSSPTTAVGGVGLMGLGAATLPLMLAALAASTPKGASGRLASLLGVAYVAGQIVALGVGWFLVSRSRTDAVFVALCVIWAVTAAFCLAWLRLAPGNDSRQVSLPGAFVVELRRSFGALWRSLGEPRTRALKVIILVAGVAPVLAGIYIPLYLIKLVEDPSRSAGYIAASTTLGYAMASVTTPLVGAYTDRQHNASSVLLVMLVVLAGIAAAMSQTTNPLVVSLLAVALTVAGQCLTMLQNALMLTHVPDESATTFFAANQLPFYGGLPIGLSLGIGVVGLTGSLGNALLVVAAMFGFSAAVWWRHVAHNPARRATSG
ncbi:MAG TPA: MFS transporter [Chloroflexota bacterium]|nr:MFS transporter [Chloroflexota bacterium]